MGDRLDRLAWISGFLLVIAYWPSWSQVAMEPKTFLLYLIGGLAWLGLSLKGHLGSRLSPAVWVPLIWLGGSTFWSVNPFMGVQRMSFFMAATGIALFLVGNGLLDALMKGVGWGLSIHALLIIAQNSSVILQILPDFWGPESLYGFAGGLFYNANMAAIPLLSAIGWALCCGSETSNSFRWHIPVWMFALLLTQSRACLLALFGLLIYWGWNWLKARNTSPSPWEWGLSLSLITTCCFFGYHIHYTAIFLLCGVFIVGICKASRVPFWPMPEKRGLISALVLTLWVGLAWRQAIDQPLPLKQRSIAGDTSVSQRKSYYLSALQGWMDAPFLGQGLGSARSHYPRLVDRNLPVAQAAYGDFVRPNNLHSDFLEAIMEGGAVLLVALGFGLYWQKKTPRLELPPGRWMILAPLLLVACVDFPLHKPFGILWLLLWTVHPNEALQRIQIGHRILMGLQASILIYMSISLAYAASLRPGVETAIRTRQTEVAWANARRIMRWHPFDAEFQDLYSKALVQWGASPEGMRSGPQQARLLDQALGIDPWDHHLLLRRAQLATAMREPTRAKECLDRYAAVAPSDPDRFLRLAQDALGQGKPTVAKALIQQAKGMPGFLPKHKALVQKLEQ